ncbi:MAG: hypothetical protein COA58_04040 [Bacteroidetes bacterium]|nr:MAG: hypothetical protein COA58_04040 [Bacteroidota bacterium]
MKILTAKPDDSPALFIQCKGLHSGRPLKEYIPNSFAVFSDDPNIFDKCFTLWKTKQYRHLIIGSVVPFIRITDTRKLVSSIFPVLDKKWQLYT